MGLYKRGKVWWYYEKGDRRPVPPGGVTDKAAATLWWQRHQRELADPLYHAAHSSTLGKALEEHIATKRRAGRAAGTLRMLDAHTATIVRVLGDVSLAHLAAEGPRAIDRFVTAREQELCERTTIYKECTTLVAALRGAKRRGEFPGDTSVLMPEISGASRAGTKHLSLEGVTRLVGYLEAPRASVVAFIVATGADWVGVEAAKAADVGDEWRVHVHGSKTSSRDRTLVIAPVLRPLWARVTPPPFEPWGNVRRDLAVACEALGLPRVSPRDLRRTCGMVLRAAGYEPHVIGSYLGHADSRMAERVYAKLMPEGLRGLLEVGRGAPKTR